MYCTCIVCDSDALASSQFGSYIHTCVHVHTPACDGSCDGGLIGYWPVSGCGMPQCMTGIQGIMY